MYVIPTVDELKQRSIDGLSAEFPSLRVTEGSEANAEALARARLAGDGQQRLGQLERNVTPAEADERGLNQWATAIDEPRKGATKSRGTQAYEVTGNPGATVSVGLQAQHISSGLLFEFTTGAAVGAGGTALVDIESVDTGTQTRLLAGEPLRLLAPPVDIDQSGRLIKSLVDGGADEEAEGAWRQRLLLIWREKRVSGSVAGYTTVTLQQPEVVDVFLYRGKPTNGSLSVMAFKDGTGTSKLQTETERNALRDILDEEIINDTIVALIPVPRTVHVDCVVALFPGFESAFASTYTVASWDASASTLTLNELLAADVGVGDLLTVESADPDATGASGRPVAVAAITGPSAVVLVSVDGSQPVIDFTPVAADNVYPSSPSMLDAWTAIRFGSTACASLAGLEELGPANREPSADRPWPSDIRVADIEQLARAQEGIDNATATLSTANAIEIAVEFAFPEDDQVEVLFAGQVVVR